MFFFSNLTKGLTRTTSVLIVACTFEGGWGCKNEVSSRYQRDRELEQEQNVVEGERHFIEISNRITKSPLRHAFCRETWMMITRWVNKGRRRGEIISCSRHQEIGKLGTDSENVWKGKVWCSRSPFPFPLRVQVFIRNNDRIPITTDMSNKREEGASSVIPCSRGIQEIGELERKMLKIYTPFPSSFHRNDNQLPLTCRRQMMSNKREEGGSHFVVKDGNN